MSSSVTPSDTLPSSAPPTEPSAPVPSAPSDPAPSDPPPPSSEPPTQESSSAPPDPQPSDPLPNPSSQQPNPEPSNPSNPSQPPPSGSQPPPTPPPNNPSNSGNPVIISTPSSGVYQSTVVETSNGVTVTRVTQISTVFPPGATVGVAPTNTGGGGKSNTGAIVGGVVGGIIGLAAIVFIFWFLSRRARQKRLEKEFDGDFNPDRIVRHSHTLPPGAGGTLPELGLDEEESRITPFPAPSSTPSMTHRPTPSTTTSFSTGNMYSVNPQQHVNDPHPYQGGYPMPVAVNRPPSSVGDHSQSIYSQSTGLTHPSMYQPQQHAAYPVAAAAAYAPSHGSSSLSGGQIPSRKAQEAGLGRMTVANPNDLVVHQDGGRVPEPAPSQSHQQEELPPTYDSIPQDRAGAGSSRA